jgi:transcriptional regulator with XRE-family HTH domain
MDSGLGTRLRTQRERKGVTLAAIADDTKISIALLEGLERDDVSRWPGGLFRRAYVRAYARAVGLEPEAIVREFGLLHPDPTSEALAQAVAHDTQVPLPRNGAGLDRELHSVATLCTALGQATDQEAVTGVLADAGRILGARGLVVWVWDAVRVALCPAISHGYPETMLRQLAALARDTDSAIATAFRTAQPAIVTGAGQATGAVVTPLLTPAGCVGVLAIEFGNGAEQRQSVRAFATILGAQLSTLLPPPVLLEAAATA